MNHIARLERNRKAYEEAELYDKEWINQHNSGNMKKLIYQKKEQFEVEIWKEISLGIKHKKKGIIDGDEF
jgi:DNA-binding GntR family transcriptional regulator